MAEGRLRLTVHNIRIRIRGPGAIQVSVCCNGLTLPRLPPLSTSPCPPLWIVIVAGSLPLQTPSRVGGVNDEYLWLEDIDGETALNWVREQNAGKAEKLAQRETFIARSEEHTSELQSR